MGNGDIQASFVNAPRFLVEEIPKEGRTTASVKGSECHHMRHVVRLQPGACVNLVDREGNVYHGRLVGYGRDEAVVALLERGSSPPRVPVILGAGIIRASRMDYLVEKAVELGASAIYPLRTARSVAKATGSERLERWHRIAEAALKQAAGASATRIMPPCEFSEFVAACKAVDLAVLCEQNAPLLAPMVRAAKPRGLALAVGPEGDFTPEEKNLAHANGFRCAGLGANRLRSETAAIAALAVARAALEEALQDRGNEHET